MICVGEHDLLVRPANSILLQVRRQHVHVYVHVLVATHVSLVHRTCVTHRMSCAHVIHRDIVVHHICPHVTHHMSCLMLV